MFSLPQHLSQTHATGIQKYEQVAQFEVGHLKNFIYLIIDWSSKSAWLIDSHKPFESIQRALDENELELKGILLTHTHHDHILGLEQILQNHSQALVLVHPKDAGRLRLKETSRIHLLKDGEKIECGEHQLRAHHTPGHSAGETSFHLVTKNQSYIFTGDTLFIGDCGRTDFEDGSDEEMFASLQFFKTFSDDTIVLPGHHYRADTASTIGREKIQNAPLKCKTVAELKALP